MLHKFTKKRTITALGVLAALVMAAGAYAYFTSSGSGTGSASVGTQAGYSVSSVSAPGTLMPVLSTDTTDGNPISATITNVGKAAGSPSVTVSIASIANGDSNPALYGCSTSMFRLIDTSGNWTPSSDGSSATTTNPMASLAVGAPASIPSGLLLQLVNNPNSSQDNCQGATVNLSVTAS